MIKSKYDRKALRVLATPAVRAYVRLTADEQEKSEAAVVRELLDEAIAQRSGR